MAGEGVLHLVGALLERGEEIAMAALKILQYFRELAGREIGIHRQHPVDDVVRPRLVGGIEIPWLGRGPERTHQYPGGIGAKEKGLTI